MSCPEPAGPQAKRSQGLMGCLFGVVEFLLSEDRDAKLGKLYHDDGDPSMYTELNMQKMAKLKENRSVADATARYTAHPALFSLTAAVAFKGHLFPCSKVFAL